MKYYTTSKISENIHETPEGYLVCVGVPIARTGEMVYGEGETPLEVGDDGQVLIRREAAAVFRPETIASFEGKAITIAHPEEFVSPENWCDLARGILQNVRRGTGENENDLIADLLITDGKAIKLVKGGLREVSCGYEADYIQTEKGRGIQTKIIGNHLALVDEGRAGSSYAINDHKGKAAVMLLKDRIKAIFARAQDEAMALAGDAESKDKKTKDDDNTDPPKPDESGLSSRLKAIETALEQVIQKIAALGGAKDEEKKPEPKETEKKPEPKEKEKTPAADDEAPEGIDDRVAKLEATIAKLLQRETKEDEVPVDEEADHFEDEEDDMPASTLTGDAASRIEILAPGLSATGKDAKAKALKAAYATADGKKVIDTLTGGKPPVFDSEEKTNTIFVAASELLKQTRTSEFSKTKHSTTDFISSVGTPAGMMTAEKMNEINAKHYGKH